MSDNNGAFVSSILQTNYFHYISSTLATGYKYTIFHLFNLKARKVSSPNRNKYTIFHFIIWQRTLKFILSQWILILLEMIIVLPNKFVTDSSDFMCKVSNSLCMAWSCIRIALAFPWNFLVIESQICLEASLIRIVSKDSRYMAWNK